MPQPKVIRVLHLEDNSQDAELIQHKLKSGGLDCNIVRVEGQKSFDAALGVGGFDLILCDYNVSGYTGLEALKLAREKQAGTPDGLKAERDSLKTELLQSTRQEFFSAYMTKAKAKMKITVNEATVKALIGG